MIRNDLKEIEMRKSRGSLDLGLREEDRPSSSNRKNEDLGIKTIG